MKHYRLVPRLYLERFADDAVLLVADRDLLLTVNSAAADLFVAATRSFGDRPFSLQQGQAWLSGQFELDDRECRARVRELLAFCLKHGLACRSATGS